MSLGDKPVSASPINIFVVPADAGRKLKEQKLSLIYQAEQRRQFRAGKLVIIADASRRL